MRTKQQKGWLLYALYYLRYLAERGDEEFPWNLPPWTKEEWNRWCLYE